MGTTTELATALRALAEVRTTLRHPLIVSHGSTWIGRDLIITHNGLRERIVNTDGGFFFYTRGWTELEHPVALTDIPRILNTYNLDAGVLTALRQRLTAA